MSADVVAGFSNDGCAVHLTRHFASRPPHRIEIAKDVGISPTVQLLTAGWALSAKLFVQQPSRTNHYRGQPADRIQQAHDLLHRRDDEQSRACPHDTPPDSIKIDGEQHDN